MRSTPKISHLINSNGQICGKLGENYSETIHGIHWIMNTKLVTLIKWCNQFENG